MKVLQTSILLFGLCAGTIHADEVRIPMGQQNATPEWRTQQPVRGSTKAQIESQYGIPDSKNGPTGDPPIYYWEYADFTVYFEGDYVIHAVSKHVRQN